MVEQSSSSSEPASSRPNVFTEVIGPLVAYTAARLAITAVLTWILMLFDVPFIVALAFGVVLQMPLSWLLLAPLRRVVTRGLERTSAHRRAERDRLRAALSGEQDLQQP